MPELPEVQTVVNSLQKIKDNTIDVYTPLWNKVCYNKNNILVKNTIQNRTIKDITRMGKYIIIKLTKDYIIFHLRMTGYLYHSKDLKKNNHTRCYFKLKDTTYLIYEDIRKFGGFYYKKDTSFLKTKVGIDPILNKEFTKKWLFKNIKSRRRQLKALLLDQSIICGLGNIYIDEILFTTGIHPLTTSSKLTKKTIDNLHDNILHILNQSINHHGTTIMNFKFDNMKTGDYKNKLKVYSRLNKKCFKCKSHIIKLKVAGRGTYVCPICQKKKC